MKEKVNKILQQVEDHKIENAEQLESFRIKYLSKKGIIPGLFAELKKAAPEDKKTLGIELNKLKNAASDKFKKIQSLNSKFEIRNSKFDPEYSGRNPKSQDLTLPPIPNEAGTRHPLSIVRRRMIEIFSRIGFNLSEGPEIEDEWHNFTALNFEPDHPAIGMQDTFFIEQASPSPPAGGEGTLGQNIVLRTHTSSVQIRVMENQKPPIRTLSPGRVFRNETISARAHCVFHQVEGLYIDEHVSFADLKQTLFYFVREMFGEDTQLRFRPSYFPFTEPSAEVDISCLICGGKGCNVCKHTGWVEIAGAGMVDPNVLKNCKIDPQKYTGYAFGMGIERITMLKYKINDLRLFTGNDVRFLRQFVGVI
ncbi:MAG: phenylalanine--tRNA ligase subunit alpha [Cytophagales bacterium]|nr:phenylalanine--tRNA ligase subunit alpha [Cytophagales bacterium]